MYTTTIKNRELQVCMTALDEIAKERTGAALAFQFANIAKKLDAQLETYSAVHNKLLDEGVERDAEGNPIKVDETHVKVKDGYLQQLIELDEQDGDAIKQVLRSAIEKSGMQISVVDIFRMGGLIYDDVDIEQVETANA